MNQVILIGNVGKDPEIRYTPNGHAVCNLSIATHKKVKEKFEPTWHRVTCWRQLAEKCAEIKKGNRIMIVGEITYRTVEKDGVKTYYTEILAWQLLAAPSLTQSAGITPEQSNEMAMENNELDDALYGDHGGM